MTTSPPPPPKSSPVNGWLIGILLLLVGMMVYRFLIERTSIFGSSTVSRPVTPRGDLAADEQTTVDIFRNASPSVVSIITSEVVTDRRGKMQEAEAGRGSGVIWDNKGHVVTNYHVIANAINGQDASGQPAFASAEVVLADNSRWPARIQSVAPTLDLAVLEVEAPTAKLSRLTPLAIGKSSELLVGQKVYAIGSPFGLNQTLTTGIISSLRQFGRDEDAMIQTDAAINPGNSGGPLLDSAGLMIGVNTMIYSPSAEVAGVGQSAGIGFAVPVDLINRVVPELIRDEHGTQPGLGVSLINDERVRRSYPSLEGAWVGHVALGSAAFDAGLRSDDIILGLDGTQIASSDELRGLLQTKEVGDSVKLTVLRPKERRELIVTVRLQPILDLENLEAAATK